MATIALELPDATVRALRALATATGAASLGQLVQDALRTYAWLLAQQDAGREIWALEPADVTVLEQAEALQGERPVLMPLRPAAKG